MKKMTANQIRQMWLDFFITKGHKLKDSFSLIPDSSDPSLLWVNAGVVPLKKYFDGSEKVFFPKIVTIQKCLRTNDIDNVGKTAIHHTFFEMLGNFSIGDYFKQETIDLVYELLTSEKWFNLSKDRLYITYFYKDQETYNFWLKKGIHSKHLISLKTNFWEIGEGPCGPCTEIFFDRGIEYDNRGLKLIKEEISNDRFIEIWNVVFSQYNSELDKDRENYIELPNKNIDTGSGLERLACIFQNTKTNFETDLFMPIIEKISHLSKTEYSEKKKIFRIIADHIRTLVFGIADGVILANEGRGYILKKILRRSFIKGQNLGFKKPFLFKLVSVVIDIMKEFYPYLETKRQIIENIIQVEEEKFLFNLIKSQKLFFKFIDNNCLSGENFFKLYDTYGLPKDMILEYANQNNIHVDELEFQSYLEKQKQLSRGAQNIKHNMNKQNEFFLNFKEKSYFIGYNEFNVKTKVLKVFAEGIVLEKTPFYPEMGGQIFDTGKINNWNVSKVLKLPNNQILHQFNSLVVPLQDLFYEGQEVIAFIDVSNRQKISCNHTATHLLYDALKLILGDHVKQRGSYLNFKYLRLDFNHFQNLSFDDLMKIENQVNKWISRQYPVTIEKIFLSEAKEKKAHFIENKIYQDKVRVVQIGDISIQLCAGTHVNNTINLKNFVILDCKNIGSGIYRIEAVSGSNISDALEEKVNPFLQEEKQIYDKIKELKTTNFNFQDFLFKTKTSLPKIKYKDSYEYIQDYKNYLQFLRQTLNEFKKQILQKTNEQVIKYSEKFIPKTIESNLMIVIENHEMTSNMLKILLDYFFNKLKIEFLCLCYKQKNSVLILCKSKLIHVGNFIKKVNKIINGKGGGNNNFGQLYSNHIDKFDELKNNWKSLL